MKLLQRPVIRGFLKTLPIIGDILESVDSNTVDSPSGEMNHKEMWVKLARLVILGTLLYFVLTNKVSLEDAEAAKGLLN